MELVLKIVGENGGATAFFRKAEVWLASMIRQKFLTLLDALVSGEIGHHQGVLGGLFRLETVL